MIASIRPSTVLNVVEKIDDISATHICRFSGAPLGPHLTLSSFRTSSPVLRPERCFEAKMSINPPIVLAGSASRSRSMASWILLCLGSVPLAIWCLSSAAISRACAGSGCRTCRWCNPHPIPSRTRRERLVRETLLSGRASATYFSRFADKPLLFWTDNFTGVERRCGFCCLPLATGRAGKPLRIERNVGLEQLAVHDRQLRHRQRIALRCSDCPGLPRPHTDPHAYCR